MDPDDGKRQPAEFHAMQTARTTTTRLRRGAASGCRRRIQIRRHGWDNGGPDRFNNGNIIRSFTGTNNGLSQFASGWLRQRRRPQLDRAQCNFRVGNAGRNIVTGPGLRWTQVSAQKNFQFTERWNAQLRWDFQNALKTYNFIPPTTAVDFRNPQKLRQAVRRSANRLLRWTTADEPDARYLLLAGTQSRMRKRAGQQACLFFAAARRHGFHRLDAPDVLTRA